MDSTNQICWRVRKKHLTIWCFVCLACDVGLIALSIGDKSVIELIGLALLWFLLLLWFLPPISLVRAAGGSRIYRFSSIRLNSSGSSNNGENSITYEHRVYNLNNAGDSFMFGLDFFIAVFKIMWWCIKLIAKFIILCINATIFVISYIIIALPFPLTTYYCFFKSNTDRKLIIKLIPAIVLVVYVIAVFILLQLN